MPTAFEPPYFPILYVRGYAGSEDAVEDTVATPYMGFNLGSTKLRQLWTGDLRRLIFESPLVRLMKDFSYRDVYEEGEAIAPGTPITGRSVIIYRYYDQVSNQLGTGDRPDIPLYAKGLGELIEKVRDQVCGDDAQAKAAFRVYLVAHSMGGLIVRSFLQNPPAGTPAVQKCVEKAFTYATPHNGIDVQVLGNVPGFFSRNNVNNFNRDSMADYLGLKQNGQTPERVDSLGGKFPEDRFFTLIGTNARDYAVAKGWSSKLVGPLSDGLVRIENASLRGCPRAFVHRSHSGDYGIVNSEEGYQNLTRFLFGNVRVDGILRVDKLTLPPEIERARKDGKKIRASYHFEVVVRTRGARYDLSRRVTSENSAIFRTYEDLFERGDNPRDPYLFTGYLSSKLRTRKQGPLVFSVELRVLVPEYEIDGFLFDHRIEGSSLFREIFHIGVDPPADANGSWSVRYGLDSHTPGRPGRTEAESEDHDGTLVFKIPVESNTNPGIKATLELNARPWNRSGG
jgi:hypothetical protein